MRDSIKTIEIKDLQLRQRLDHGDPPKSVKPLYEKKKGNKEKLIRLH